MVDGFPMSRRGEAARALSAAISTSWVNGLVWGLAVFLFLSWYTQIVPYFGTVEMFSVSYIPNGLCYPCSSKYWSQRTTCTYFRCDGRSYWNGPVTAPDPYTSRWDYLGDGEPNYSYYGRTVSSSELFSAYRMKAEKFNLQTVLLYHNLLKV